MRVSFLLSILFVLSSRLFAQEPPALGSAAGLPITEVTIFKDGHAYVIHEGKLKLDEDGRAVLGDLPEPVLGTFWPASHDPKSRLKAVRAGEREINSVAKAETLADLVRANPGAEVWLQEQGGDRYATRLSSREGGPLRGSLLFLETDLGERILPFNLVRDLTFRNPEFANSKESKLNRKVLELEFDGAAQGVEVGATVSYVQQGLRWIPSYRVNLDGEGKATLEMRATIVNDLRDLENCRVQLVVGVPSFEFKDYRDPIALTQFLQSVASNAVYNNNPIASNFSNSIMNSQVASYDVGRSQGDASTDGLDSGVLAADGQSNLFFYSLEGISLKKGDRMSLMVATIDLDYEDIYTLDIPFQAPRSVVGVRHSTQADQWARLAAKPKVRHQVRINNSSVRPLTTAPALVIEKGRVIAQGLLRYTAPGASCKLPLTQVIDVRVEREDIETGQTPDALRMHSYEYHRVDISGKIALRNLSKTKKTIEVTRYLVGRSDDEPANGKRVTLSQYEDLEDIVIDGETPSRWYSWPGWWSFVNGLERFSWTVELEADKEVEIPYTWYYYWR